jgi:hypothetical protein
MLVPIGTKLQAVVPQKTATAMKALAYAYFMQNKDNTLKSVECWRFMARVTERIAD